jgi:hypothetical protein
LSSLYTILFILIILTLLSSIISTTQAQQTDVIKQGNVGNNNNNNIIRVAATLFGIDNRTGTVITFVTVKNMTKAIVSNVSALALKNPSTNGAVVVSLGFPHNIAIAGDQIRACGILVKNLKIFCSAAKIPFMQTNVIFVQLFLNPT